MPYGADKWRIETLMKASDHKHGEWAPWWEWCPQKSYFSDPPDFSGLYPETGEPWSPAKVVEALGLTVQDSSKTRNLCERIIREHPQVVESYRGGKTKVIGKLIKATLDASGGSADPREVSTILRELLGS